MQANQDYLELISEFIKKQMIMLGPGVVLSKARKLGELTIEADGRVAAIGRDPLGTLKRLTREFEELSGQITYDSLYLLLGKYPEIKKQITTEKVKINHIPQPESSEIKA